jgi:hypothetical protein
LYHSSVSLLVRLFLYPFTWPRSSTALSGV